MSVKPSIVANPGALLAQARLMLATDPEAAAGQLRQLLIGSPGEPKILRLLGAALRRLGKDGEAEAAETEAIAASTRSPAHRQAAQAVAAGDSERATALLRSILADDDTDVVALVMLGLQASLAKERDKADALLGRAVSLAPCDPSARLALAEHMQRTQRSAKALDQLDRLKEEAAEGAAALSLRAKVCRSLGRLDEEIALLVRLKGGEDGERYQLRLGHALRGVGRADEAVAAYRAVLATNPREGAAWWSLANLKTVRFSDDDIRAMQGGLADAASGTPLNLIRLNFALGKAYEDRGEPELAWRHYDEGNRRKEAIASYKPENISRWVDGSIKHYTKRFYAERADAGSPSPDPIFIVGMQRSGSTLVEQILASHPAIEGTAELVEMATLVRTVGDRARKSNQPFSDYLASLGPGQLADLGEQYIEATRVHRVQGKPRFTDKMPNNWQYAPLIRLILPEAKIIDVRRHPLACCFSNYKQLYGSGLEHSYSMEWMGRYYADYVRLMRHVEEVQPGTVHRIIYERLVEDPEGEVRRLFDYLELPFDEAVLDFHSSKRAVRTISAEQVRRPIYRDGLDQWRAFEQWLGPMKEALGPALEDWDR